MLKLRPLKVVVSLFGLVAAVAQAKEPSPPEVVWTMPTEAEIAAAGRAGDPPELVRFTLRGAPDEELFGAVFEGEGGPFIEVLGPDRAGARASLDCVWHRWATCRLDPRAVVIRERAGGVLTPQLQQAQAYATAVVSYEAPGEGGATGADALAERMIESRGEALTQAHLRVKLHGDASIRLGPWERTVAAQHKDTELRLRLDQLVRPRWVDPPSASDLWSAGMRRFHDAAATGHTGIAVDALGRQQRAVWRDGLSHGAVSSWGRSWRLPVPEDWPAQLPPLDAGRWMLGSIVATGVEPPVLPVEGAARLMLEVDAKVCRGLLAAMLEPEVDPYHRVVAFRMCGPALRGVDARGAEDRVVLTTEVLEFRGQLSALEWDALRAMGLASPLR